MNARTESGITPEDPNPTPVADELARANRTLRMLSNSNQSLIRIDEETALLREICRIVVEDGGYSLASVGLLDDGGPACLGTAYGDNLTPNASVDKTLALWWRNSEPLSVPVASVLESGRPFICQDILAASDLSQWHEEARRHGFTSLVALPLTAEGEMLGVMGILASQSQMCDEQELAILQELAGDLAFGIARLRNRDRQVHLERQVESNLSYFQSMDRINLAIQGADDLDQMMEHGLDAVLDVFQVDRAFLMYPCDIAEPYWFVPMERTKTGYPGVNAKGRSVPLSDEMRSIIGLLTATDEPVTIGPDGDLPISQRVAQTYGVKSFMAVIIRPKLGKPWLFGIHQCSHDRRWTQDDSAMFKAISQRMGDALSVWLSHDRVLNEQTRLRTLTRTIPDLVWLKDPNGVFLFCNEQFERLCGAPESEIIGQTDEAFVSKELAEFFRANDRRAAQSGHPMVNEEWLTFARDGYHGLFETIKTPLYDTAGKLIGVLGTARDITERKNAQEQLKIAAVAFEGQEAIVITDNERRILKVNRSFCRLSGYGSEEVVGQPIDILKAEIHDEAFYRSLQTGLDTTGDGQWECYVQSKDGRIHPVMITGTAIKDDAGGTTLYVFTTLDISARKEAEQEIERLAYYDVLTELPNRRLLLDRLHLALAEHARTGRQGVVLFIDLDNFKILNDTAGHGVGDRLLVDVARRLRSGVREVDTVARLGGDEFVVMMRELGDDISDTAPMAKAIGEKIRHLLAQPYEIAGHSYHITPSIGVTIISEHVQSVDDLLKQADIAMYQAKSAGRNTLRFFDPDMQAALAARADMEKALRTGLGHSEFVLFYQPQVDKNGQVLGAETLLRWRHSHHGLIAPGEFISLAEDTGLILPLGRWVLETACAQLTSWASDPVKKDLYLAVNVSARQFRQPDFIDDIREVLERTGASPEHLKLELTESVVLDDIDDTIEKMQALKALGIGFAMDDFGTGYSSLTYLTRLPLDQVKIDQSFVRHLPHRASDAAVVQAIITLAGSLGLGVVAEGVENQVQLDFLTLNGCPIFQGYYFSPPLPLAEFEAFLSDGARSPL
jgi:diguanylate cyclase (GGDEF)-like protein/PAS domain S-box-containing protein